MELLFCPQATWSASVFKSEFRNLTSLSVLIFLGKDTSAIYNINFRELWTLGCCDSDVL